MVRQSKRTAKSKVNYYESASDAEDDESEANENEASDVEDEL